MTRSVVHPLVQAAAACVHEEVTDRGQLQTQLLGDGYLELFGWTLVFLEDGMECPPLHICEHQPRLLGYVSPIIPPMVLFFALACEASLTCEPECAHALELRLLQPFPHAAERLSPGLELGPGLGVPQQVGQRPLGPAQDPLCEDGLRDAVALELCGDPLRYLFGIHFFHLSSSPNSCSNSSRGYPSWLSGSGGLLPSAPQSMAVALRGTEVGVWVMVQAVNLDHARGANVLLRVAAQHGWVVRLEAAGSKHLLPGHGGARVRVRWDACLGRMYAG